MDMGHWVKDVIVTLSSENKRDIDRLSCDKPLTDS